MATFPETPVPIYPFSISQRFNTAKSPMNSGVEERTAKWLFPKYDVRLQYNVLTAANAQILWNFYQARKGGYEAFYIYDFSLKQSITKDHEDQYVGTGDGSTTIFDIPGRSTSSHDIFIDNIEEADANYTILTGGGSSSSDRVEFDTAPSAGDIITVDFSGYLRMRVVFAQDNMTEDLFILNRFNLELELRGLAAA